MYKESPESQLLTMGYLVMMSIRILFCQEALLQQGNIWQFPLVWILLGLYVLRGEKIVLQVILWVIMIGVEIFLAAHFSSQYLLLLPPLIMRLAGLLSMPWLIGITLLGILKCDMPLIYLMVTLFLGTFKAYESHMAHQYQIMTLASMRKENHLQDTLDEREHIHKSKLESFTLDFEVKRLEEKGKLAQVLHDRLGHSINGSIFQLEACKLMLDTRPEETKEKLQSIIDHLRESMDEIRYLLREEKPKKSEMSELKLRSFCKEFEVQYGIFVKLIIKGETSRVSEKQWKVLMDCLFEAFSNALKYASCGKIEVQLKIFPKILRMEITDDGRGCSQIKEGMGISGMKERVEALGGVVSISSEIGFSINVLIPIKEAD